MRCSSFEEKESSTFAPVAEPFVDRENCGEMMLITTAVMEQKKKKKKKSLRFATKLTSVWEVPSLRRWLSPVEKGRVWFSKAEITALRNECMDAASGKLGNDVELRGLESRTPKGSKRRNAIRSAGLSAVLHEQAKQQRKRRPKHKQAGQGRGGDAWTEQDETTLPKHQEQLRDLEPTDAIAEVYRRSSQWCQLVAHATAFRDRVMVLKDQKGGGSNSSDKTGENQSPERRDTDVALNICGDNDNDDDDDDTADIMPSKTLLPKPIAATTTRSSDNTILLQSTRAESETKVNDEPVQHPSLLSQHNELLRPGSPPSFSETVDNETEVYQSLPRSSTTKDNESMTTNNGESSSLLQSKTTVEDPKEQPPEHKDLLRGRPESSISETREDETVQRQPTELHQSLPHSSSSSVHAKRQASNGTATPPTDNDDTDQHHQSPLLLSKHKGLLRPESPLSVSETKEEDETELHQPRPHAKAKHQSNNGSKTRGEVWSERIHNHVKGSKVCLGARSLASGDMLLFRGEQPTLSVFVTWFQKARRRSSFPSLATETKEPTD